MVMWGREVTGRGWRRRKVARGGPAMPAPIMRISWGAMCDWSGLGFVVAVAFSGRWAMAYWYEITAVVGS